MYRPNVLELGQGVNERTGCMADSIMTSNSKIPGEQTSQEMAG